MSTTITKKTVVASDDCLATTIGSETVILHTTAGEYYGFNEIGSAIWDFVQQPRNVEEVVGHVSSEYDVSDERCRNDVTELLSQLSEYGLVRFVED